MIYATPVDMTAVADAGQQATTYANLRPFAEPDVENDQTQLPREPDLFQFPRQPFGGLRLVMRRLSHYVMPPAGYNVGGPPQVIITNGKGFWTGGKDRAANPQNRAVKTWEPVAQPQPYWEYLN